MFNLNQSRPSFEVDTTRRGNEILSREVLSSKQLCLDPIWELAKKKRQTLVYEVRAKLIQCNYMWPMDDIIMEITFQKHSSTSSLRDKLRAKVLVKARVLTSYHNQ